MDISSILSAVSAALPFPWSLVAGAVLVVGYQWLKVRFPDATSPLPHLVPTPGAPTPAAPSDHPIIDGILQKILGKNAPTAADLAAELGLMAAPLADEIGIQPPPPSPATPVAPPK